MFSKADRDKCRTLFQRYYSDSKFGDEMYRDLVEQNLHTGEVLLDAGCGRDMNFCLHFSKIAGAVVGLDLEKIQITRNEASPFGLQGDLAQMPFAADSFDIVISRSVVEHLVDPGQVFREYFRVLRPGGRLVMITPNKYDYVSLIAALTPYRLHRHLVSKIFQSPENDVFPTFYRANTKNRLKKALEQAGLVEVEIAVITHYPAYLSFSPLLFRLGVLYERITRLRLCEGLRASILCVFSKPTVH